MIEAPEKNPARRSRAWGAALLALGMVLGIGGTRLVGHHHPDPVRSAPGKKQMYQCAMHPQVLLDYPGDCPICGMKLVPVAAEPPSQAQAEAQTSDGHVPVRIDLDRQQLIGLSTAEVAEGPVSAELRATGRVTVDETRVRKLNVKVEGFVDELFVDYLGKPVAKGAPLFSLYSPEFLSAQQEYLLALRTRKALAGGSLQSSGVDLLAAARARLALWDVPGEVAERLERTGEVQRALTLRSPIAGVVTAKNVVAGARLTPADIPFEITDLSHLWVQVDIYESELGRIQPGMAAELSLEAFPGKLFKGRISFIDPLMDPKTRTARVRLEVPNPLGELKPEMFAEVLLKGVPRKGILIPLDAVLDAGASKLAFVALGDGKFEPRQITTGATIGEKVEVLSGLRPGERVVVRASFLVDSESRLRAALAQLGRKTPAPAAAGRP